MKPDNMDHNPNDLGWIRENDPIHYGAIRDAERYCYRCLIEKLTIARERDAIKFGAVLFGFGIVTLSMFAILLKTYLTH